MTWLRRTLAWMLLTAGLGSLGWSGALLMRADYEQTVRARALPEIRAVGNPQHGQTLGLLEIPRLSLRTVVVEGDDPTSLLVAAGHLPDTPLPWQPGNSVVAAHRDTDFRPLKDIREGDVIRFHTADTAMEFVVREFFVVEPTDLTVLRPTAQPTLTLITCHPFNYVGPAPRRFIVRAERVPGARAIL
jgi:sortase A